MSLSGSQVPILFSISLFLFLFASHISIFFYISISILLAILTVCATAYVRDSYAIFTSLFSGCLSHSHHINGVVLYLCLSVFSHFFENLAIFLILWFRPRLRRTTASPSGISPTISPSRQSGQMYRVPKFSYPLEENILKKYTLYDRYVYKVTVTRWIFIHFL